MKGMIKDALILFAITLVAGLMLGLVYDVTKEPIAEQQEKKKTQACQSVFPEAALFEDSQIPDETTTAQLLQEQGINGASIDEVVTAKSSDGIALGYVITVTDHEGYGGDIQFSMGITMEGTLNGISLLSISETPGLGMNAEEVLVPQFAGKQVGLLTYTKTGAASDTQIDAISGATITTSAVVDGVNAGLIYYESQLKGGNAE